MKAPDVILRTLQDAGYEAYYVGGCVRDTLMGRPIHDWDITTSASPEQIMACFSHCVPTGIAHGTVTVLTEDGQAEVTTFRSDGQYLDGRHPVGVTFVSRLEEDLSRRDFTVNAMAMDAEGNLKDPLGGREDLKNRVLACVGEPETRFREDALRMLRAVRFSAQLGFTIEAATWQAMVRCAPLCRKLSAERVREETEKILMSSAPEKMSELLSLGLLEPYAPKQDTDCDALSLLPKDRTARWAGLCRILPELDLTALRLDRKTAADAMEVSRLPVPKELLSWKRLAAEQGEVRTRLLAVLEGEEALVETLFASGQCLSLRQLAVTGKDFPHLQGPAVGNVLKTLLEHVLQHPEDNKKEKLLKIYKNKIDSCY